MVMSPRSGTTRCAALRTVPPATRTRPAAINCFASDREAMPSLESARSSRTTPPLVCVFNEWYSFASRQPPAPVRQPPAPCGSSFHPNRARLVTSKVYMGRDLSYALRSLKKSPAFTAVAILTLACGIGANTAIFSVINSVLLRPLAYQNPDRLVFLWSSSASLPREPLSPARLIDFREQLTSVTAIAGISHIPLNLTGGGEPERLDASSVSSGFFDILAVPALLGDPFH